MADLSPISTEELLKKYNTLKNEPNAAIPPENNLADISTEVLLKKRETLLQTLSRGMKEEFRRGLQKNIEQGKGFVAGFKEKWPQTIGSTVTTMIPLAGNLMPGAVATPEELLTVPAGQAVGKALTQALTRMALSYGGGAAGKAVQETGRAIIGSEKAPKDIWEAIDRIEKAGEEEFIGQGIGEAIVPIAGKMLAPFASRTIPAAPALSKKLGQAAQRIPAEKLAEMPPYLRKMLTAKTLLPRFYRDATGKLKFARVPKIQQLLTPAQKTISPALDWVENATESSIFGGGRIKLEKQYIQPAALGQLLDETTESFWANAGKKLSNDETAELFIDSITDSKIAWRSQQKIIYRQIDKLMAKTSPLTRGPKGQFIRYKMVSLDKANKIADDILSKATSGAGPAPQRKKLAMLVKKWIVNNPDGLTFENAITYRSDLLEDLRKFESAGYKNATLKRDYARVAMALDSQMARTAKNNGELVYNYWRAGNHITKQGYAKFQTVNMKNALRAAENTPEKLSDVFFQPYSAEGVQELKKLVPEKTFNTLRANWVEKQIRGATDANGNILWRGFQKKLSEQALGKETIAAIFPEKELYKGLTDTAKIASILQEKGGAGGGMVMQLTQSGQIVMSLAAVATGQPVKGKTLGVLILTPLQAARILTHRGGSRWLAEGFKLPVWSPQAAGFVTKVLKLTQGEKPIAPMTDYLKRKKEQQHQYPNQYPTMKF